MRVKDSEETLWDAANELRIALTVVLLESPELSKFVRQECIKTLENFRDTAEVLYGPSKTRDYDLWNLTGNSNYEWARE